MSTAFAHVAESSIAALPVGAPLAAQYLVQVQHLLPADVLQHPGSRDFRLALREVGATMPVQLMPSRGELRRTLFTLAELDALLPQLRIGVAR